MLARARNTCSCIREGKWDDLYALRRYLCQSIEKMERCDISYVGAEKMNRGKVIDLQTAMTKRELKLFWLLMDTCKKIAMATDDLSAILQTDEIGLLEDMLPYDQIAEILNRDGDNEQLGSLLVDYWGGRIEKAEFRERLAQIPTATRTKK